MMGKYKVKHSKIRSTKYRIRNKEKATQIMQQTKPFDYFFEYSLHLNQPKVKEHLKA